MITNQIFAQCEIAFTHPLASITNKTSIYRAPDVYFKELDATEEGGWEVCINAKIGNYFHIDIRSLELYNIWIHIGELGTIIQNYSLKSIPIYDSPDTSSTIIHYINSSRVGLVYDISGDFLFLQINNNPSEFWDWNNYFFGWIERKYLCGSPRTSCP